MAPKGVEIPRFGGLDLRDDPQEVSLGAALDGLNVDMSLPGRLKARGGYAKFTAAAADAPYSSLMPFYRTSSATQRLVAIKGTTGAVNSVLQVLDINGTVFASQNVSDYPHAAMVRFGTPINEFVLAWPFRYTNGAPTPLATGYQWSTVGSWVAVAVSGSYGASAAAAQKSENRVMVAAQVTAGQGPVIWFSAAGNPLSYSDYVDVTPGDGEYVVNLTSYRDLVFAFKQTKFFVFYGNDTSSTGTLVPKYRSVDAGIGCACPRGAVAAPEGVYFLDRTGVYLTTGSTPRKVSGPLDPLFGKGSLPSYYQGSAINWASIEWATLDYYNGALMLSVPTGVSTTNDTTFVFDVASQQWMPWNLKANGVTSFRIGDQEELVFSLSSGTNDIVRMGQPFTYTTDAGTAIATRYRTGFWNPGDPGAEAWVREILLDGVGTVTVKSAVNDAATLGSGAAVTLGTSPAVARGRDRRGLRARSISYELSGTAAPWSVSHVEPLVWGQRTAGMQAS
jgi:hypothetical protein